MSLARLQVRYPAEVQLGNPLSETVRIIFFKFPPPMTNASYLLARMINHMFVHTRMIAVSAHVIPPHFSSIESVTMDTYQVVTTFQVLPSQSCHHHLQVFSKVPLVLIFHLNGICPFKPCLILLTVT